VEAKVEPTVTPPIFVVDEDRDGFPLTFVAGTLEEFATFVKDHAEETNVPEGEIRFTSRVFDLTGRRWSYEGGGGSGGGLVPTEDEVSQQYLRDIVTRGHVELVRFALESLGFEQMAAYLAQEWGSNLPQEPATPGNKRHRDKHRAKNLPINASH
jgi:hypothetical protein